MAFYVSTDFFFAMGFISFQLAIACALFAYGWFLKASRDRDARAFLCYALLVLLGYALHLSALIFVGAMVGTALARFIIKREVSVTYAAGAASRSVRITGGTYYMVRSAPNAYFDWGTWQHKLIDLASPATRFARLPEMGLFVLFLVTAIFPLYAKPWRNVLAQNDQLILAVVFLVMYFTMPSSVPTQLYEIDKRALPYMLLFLVFAGARAGAEYQRR